MTKLSASSTFYGELLFICVLVVLWWLYLCLTTEPSLVFDGAGYQNLGQLIYEKGFGAYLHQGPSREPLFPILVAVAMWVGAHCHVAYQYPLRLMGIASLLITMVMAHRLMLLLKINRLAAALGILFLGFSPTLINSTLWLWSEFAAYPFVVLAVWWTIKSWQLLQKESNNGKSLAVILGYGATLALIFIGLMCVKAVAQAVIFLYLIPFIFEFFYRFKKRGWLAARPWLIFFISVVLVFEGFVQGYQWLNLQANGHYQFTNRGDWAFYSNTARRMEPLTMKRLGAAIAFVADGDLCVRIFGYPDCAFWTARHSDDINAAKTKELDGLHLTDQEKTHYYIHQGLGMMLANPLQALLTMLIEAHNIFFWETPPNFVVYPDWMDKFIYNSTIGLVLKFVIAFLCWGAFVLAAWMLLWRRNLQTVAVWFIFSFIFWYAGVYSLFFILDRYAFPIASLMIILVSFAVSPVCQNIRFHVGLGISVRICMALVLLVVLMLGPLTAQIKDQHQRVKEKSKYISIEYYRPYFPYFASIATGQSMPDADLMDGYHFGTGYTFYTYYQMAASSFPENDVPQALLGFCQYYQGNIDGALADYKKAYQIKPDFWWNNYNLAVIYFNKGNYQESALLLNKLISLNFQLSWPHLQNTPFYQRIWQYIQGPGPVLVDNYKHGAEDALLALTVCLLHLQDRWHAQQLAKQVVLSGRTEHKDLWLRLLKIAQGNKIDAENLLAETNSVKTLARVRIF